MVRPVASGAIVSERLSGAWGSAASERRVSACERPSAASSSQLANLAAFVHQLPVAGCRLPGTPLALVPAMTGDLRFAWRTLWKNPTTTLGAMLALALGIGATTTMFGLLNAVALRPLPYPDAERIVELWGNVERQVVERRGTSIPDY